MSLAPEEIEAVRALAAARDDIARVVLREQLVEPRGDAPFTDVELVVVLVDPPNDPPPREFAHGILAPLHGVLSSTPNLRLTIPSPLGEAAATRGGTVIYERGAGA